jgi:hypothetical protein
MDFGQGPREWEIVFTVFFSISKIVNGEIYDFLICFLCLRITAIII